MVDSLMVVIGVPPQRRSQDNSRHSPSGFVVVLRQSTVARRAVFLPVDLIVVRLDWSVTIAANMRTRRARQRLGAGWCIHSRYWRASTEAFGGIKGPTKSARFGSIGHDSPSSRHSETPFSFSCVSQTAHGALGIRDRTQYHPGVGGISGRRLTRGDPEEGFSTVF